LKKVNWILREILYRVFELGEVFMSQLSVARACGCSLDAVNRVVGRLESIGAVEKRPFGFRVSRPKKVLLYWAATRNLRADLVYATYSPEPVEEIERMLPPGSVLTAFAGCRKRFPDLPPYDVVHVYSDPQKVKVIFPEKEAEPNLYILRQDPHLLKRTNGCPLAQLYVDLWQLGDPLAERYLARLEEVLERRAVDALKALIESLKGGEE
jgi:hypothetical protein